MDTESYPTFPEGYPVLPAFTFTDGTMKAWCPFCKEWHFHGQSEGHRGAHCTKADSPFHKTGYILIDCAKIDGWPEFSNTHVDE